PAATVTQRSGRKTLKRTCAKTTSSETSTSHPTLAAARTAVDPLYKGSQQNSQVVTNRSGRSQFAYSTTTRRTYTGVMWRWVLPVAVVVAVLLGFMASRNGPTQHTKAHGAPTQTTPPTTAAPTVAPTCGAKHGQPAKVRHVVWIWMGTQGYTHVIGKLRVAPYMNQLAQACGLATRYTTITHPAISNDVG